MPARRCFRVLADGGRDHGSGDLEGKLLEHRPALERQHRPRRQGGMPPQRRQGLARERQAGAGGAVRQTRENVRVKLEGKATVALAVMVRAFDRFPTAQEKPGTGRQQCGAAAAVADEAAGQDEGDGSRFVPLLEGPVARSAGANDVEYPPTQTGRQPRSFRTPGRAVASLAGQRRCQGIAAPGQWGLPLLTGLAALRDGLSNRVAGCKA